MNYRQKPEIVEAVRFDTIATALAFLHVGEYNVVDHDGVYLLTEWGNHKVLCGTDNYLVRRNGSILSMDADAFEEIYEEAQ